MVARAPSMLVMYADGSRPLVRAPLAKQALTVGRGHDNDIVLEDATVSRRHLTLTLRDGHWYAQAIAGAGPLFVEGRACAACEVRPGDQMAVGGVVLRLEWPTEPEPLGANAQGVWGTARADASVATLTIDCPAGTFVAPLREAHITLGRAPECALIIPSRVISTHFATLERGEDGAYTFIADAHARNPTLLRGVPVQSRILRHGDTLNVGARESGAFAVLTYAAPFAQAATRTPAAQSIPLETPANGTVATMGRDPKSTFCLASPLVSWHHARLPHDAVGVLIEDLGSTNGTYVNLARIERSRAHRLVTGDTVQIGPYAFVFDGTRLMPQATSGSRAGLRVEALDLVRTTRGGRTVLLDHVTLSAEPGQFVAIIGGNGAGKSMLLKALAGIQPAPHGAVLLEGIDSYEHYDLFRGRIGYVPQADIVHTGLTVEEALYFTARLRLSPDLRDEEIKQRIQLVLATVDLSPHQEKLVGSLSGGERKRLSLAVELLAEPQVLFLDEPNAALDPNHRQELRATIRALANQGRTLVMVTHFREDFDACDRVAVMGRGGRLCFYGAPADALRFFGVTRFEDIYSLIEGAEPANAWRQRYQQLPRYLRELQAYSIQQTLGGSEHYASLRPGWTPVSSGVQRSRLGEFGLLSRRYARLLSRDRVNLAILLLQAPVIGLILAAVSKAGAFTSDQGPSEAEKVLFFLAIVAIWFGTSNSVREISKEGDIYQRERLAGLRILPYVLSKAGILALLCLAQTLDLLLIVAVRVGLPPSGASLFFSPMAELYVGTALAGLAGLGLGLCVSAFASNPDKAVSAVPLVLLPQILLAGVIFPLSGPVQPLADLTISRWAVQALGTTADLNHLYYTQAQVVSGSSQAGAPPDNYSPGDFDLNPNPAQYTPGVAAGISWADAQDSRRQRTLLLWSTEASIFVALLGVTIARQKAKDPS